MIKDTRELQQAIEQLGRMYRAMASLRADVLPRSTDQFRLMSEGPLDQIAELQRDIDRYLGLLPREEGDEADLWLAVHGRSIGWQTTPISILTAFLDSFRKGVQAVAEFLVAGQPAARPKGKLKQSCDFAVYALQPGSLHVGLRVPNVTAGTQQTSQVEAALAAYLDVAAWAASDADMEELDRRVADVAKRRLLLNALKPFVPRPRGAVDHVEIRGRVVPQAGPILLTRFVHRRLDEAIDRTVSERVETHVGSLREIDLDNQTFFLRNAGDLHELRCAFGEDLLEIAKTALDRTIRVTGTRRIAEGRRTQTQLHVTRLEVLEEPECDLAIEPGG